MTNRLAESMDAYHLNRTVDLAWRSAHGNSGIPFESPWLHVQLLLRSR